MLRKIAIHAARGLAGVLALGAIAVIALLFTAPGHDTVSWIVGETTNVTITGLSGDLPDNIHAESVEISDAGGVWLRAENVSLRWSALSLWNDHVDIERVSAARIVVLRRPVPSGEPGTTPRIDVSSLRAPRIELARPVAGTAALLRAEGSLHYVSGDVWRADLTAARLDNADTYRLNGGIDRSAIDGYAAVTEGDDGILGPLLGFAPLKPIHLDARADSGAVDNRISIAMKAGALIATGDGVISLAARRIDLDVTASAPAMNLRDDLSWQSLVMDMHWHGAIDAPRVQGAIRIEKPKVMGTEAATISASVKDSRGAVDIDATIAALRIPAAQPDLFAATPVAIRAHADLDAESRPVDFTISHTLMTVAGRANARGKFHVAATAAIPSVAPFAALVGEDVRGTASAKLELSGDAVQLDSRLDLDGPSLISRLLGRDAALALKMRMNGSDVLDSSLRLEGAAVNLQSRGSFRSQRLDYAATVALSDLSRLSTRLNGSASLSAKVLGPLGTARVTANGDAMMASTGFAQQHIAFSLTADGFPNPATAQVRAGGNLDGAAIALRGDLSGEKTRTAKVSAQWKSLDAHGEFLLPQKGAITGLAAVKVKQLADLASFIGTRIDGSVAASLAIRPSAANVEARLADLSFSSVKIGAADVGGAIGDPFGRPVLALAVKARGISSGDLAGNADLRLNGPLDRIAIALTSELADAQVAGNAVLDMPKQRLGVQQLRADWRQQRLVLRAPANLDFAQGVSVDRLSAQLAGGELQVSGRFTPKLAATVSARGIDAQIVQVFAPHLAAAGTLSADATLSGTLDAPHGTFALQGHGLRAKAYSSKALPPAELDLRGELRGKEAAINATLSAGTTVHLTATGDAGSTLKLHLAGSTDMQMFNPILAASGQQARGRVSMDLNISGAAQAPQLSGQATLADGEIQDFARGIHMRAINATAQADGRILRISDLKAQAGSGTIGGQGTIDLAAPGTPVNFSIEARNARPIVSDLMTATLSGNLNVTGSVRGTITVAGRLDISQGEINLPERFPPSVAVLDVRRPGKGATAPPPQNPVQLDIAARTTGPIFMRGHGIDADFRGRIKVTGASDAPVIDGGFDMNRGTFAIAGQTLNFTTGKLSFDGAGIRNRIDPTLNFVAQTNSGGVTATLTVGGYASSPKIVLSSSPDLPQDEVLAHLLFGQGAKQLTPLQLAQIAQALAALGGVGSSFDPLGMVRRQLGLDRLSVGSTTGGASGTESQTTVEAGKYVARNVYVGAKQNLSGGTQVQVQVDLTRKLKAQATLSTGTTATVTGNASQDNGSSVGLSYEFEY
jgi:translocation and assembly module TamB